MLRKLNTKSLGIAFIVLLAIVVLVTISEKKNGERSFKKQLVTLNPEEITLIKLQPRSLNGKEIQLVKTSENWEINFEGKSYVAGTSNIQSMLSELENLQPISMVGTSKDRWDTYEVSDSLGTRVIAMKGKKTVADVYIGKFKFSQPQNLSTYVRLANENETYSVNGFLSMTFNKQISDLRDKTLIKSTKNDWTKLTFTYPADSSFVLSKGNDARGVWLVNNVPADSSKVEDYLSSIQNLSPQQLSNEEEMTSPVYALKIEGNNLLEPIQLKCFEKNNEFYVESNQNNQAYFNDQNTIDKVFIGLENLR